MKALITAIALVAASASALAQSSGVDWSRYGLEDVARQAECASQRMPSAASADVLAAYWGPSIEHNGRCVPSHTTVNDYSKSRARDALLPALSACTGRDIRSDSDPWVRRVGYATAIIAAKGINDWATGKNKLSEYVGRTVACQP